MKGRRLVDAAPDAPIVPGDLIEGFGVPCVFAPGHPLRATRCLVCASMIGGREIRLYTIIVTGSDNCLCGSIPTITYAICADHGTESGMALPLMALDRWERHHGEVH